MANRKVREPKPYPWWLKGALKLRAQGYTAVEIHDVYGKYAPLSTIRNYMSAFLRSEVGFEEAPKERKIRNKQQVLKHIRQKRAA